MDGAHLTKTGWSILFQELYERDSDLATKRELLRNFGVQLALTDPKEAFPKMWFANNKKLRATAVTSAWAGAYRYFGSPWHSKLLQGDSNPDFDIAKEFNAVDQSSKKGTKNNLAPPEKLDSNEEANQEEGGVQDKSSSTDGSSSKSVAWEKTKAPTEKA